MIYFDDYCNSYKSPMSPMTLQPPTQTFLGFVTRSCPTSVRGAGTRDEPLRMSAWEANDIDS